MGMSHKFSLNVWLHYKGTNEYGYVRKCFALRGKPVYEVRVLLDPEKRSWEYGAVLSTWAESDVEESARVDLPAGSP
jgi:hypothetical protein